MAIKRDKQTPVQVEETEISTQEETQEEVQDTAPVTPTTSTTPATPKRRGGPKGPRGPLSTPGAWGEGETRDQRDMALFELLRGEKSKGSIRTAESVARALSEDTDLFPQGLKSFDVASRVRMYQKAFKANDQVAPSWLQLDEKKAAASVNLGLFQ